MLHKLVESLSLGIILGQISTKKKFYTWLLIIFSSMTPVGIFLGLIFYSVDHAKFKVVVSSLASGVFVYISISDIIPQEFSVGKNKKQKFWYFCMGIAFMSILLFSESYLDDN